MALLFLCLIFGTGRTQKIEAAVQNVPESLEEESRLDTVGTDQETERAAVREKKGQQEKEAGDTETDQAAAAQDELLAELDFDAIQQEVDSLLSSQQFSFAGTVRSLLQDGDPFRIFRAGNARSLLCQNSIPCAEGADEGAVSPRSGRRGARQFFLSL